ncbi:MAG: hypothetical protein ACJ72H_01425 [Candidatus Sulfotelmatobacter sp.]
MKSTAVSCFVSFALVVSTAGAQQLTPTPSSSCQIHAVVFDGWQAQELANEWVKLTFVPQLGGRLMQISFNGHPYLFVNQVYKGKYISPAEAAGRWINYGGDKIWPLPEGNDDEQHWTGASTPLDDGAYAFSILSQNNRCTVRLEGPPDPPTGLQYTREISIGSDSPEISFHAITRNITGHSIAWSVQSVSQYDLSDASDPNQYNHDFWAFAPLNPRSSYLNGYHVRDGLANDPSFSVKDGLFRLNWRYLENEVWLDSTAGWIALVDGATHYAMVEKTRYIEGADYPGNASVIFYKNGPTVQLNAQGMPYLSSKDLKETPYYMEAELNSPMAILTPGSTYAMDTHWFPSRMSTDLKTVTEAGLVGRPLVAKKSTGQLELSGSFGVFFPGGLKAYLYDEGGAETEEVSLQSVQPQDLVQLSRTINTTKNVARVSLHLIDNSGLDRGALGEVFVTGRDEGR